MSKHMSCTEYCNHMSACSEGDTGVLARSNKLNGRSENSRVDLTVYCPPEVLQVGGPLFGDIPGIQHRLDTFMQQKCVEDKLHIPKCTTCGYPDCDCISCIEINASRGKARKTKAHGKHTCALAWAVSHKGGAPPRGGYYHDIELHSHFKLAWEAKGMQTVPEFKKVSCALTWILRNQKIPWNSQDPWIPQFLKNLWVPLVPWIPWNHSIQDPMDSSESMDPMGPIYTN